MNTAGNPTNPALTSAGSSSQGSFTELRTIRAEMDGIRQQGIAAMVPSTARFKVFKESQTSSFSRESNGGEGNSYVRQSDV